MTDRVLLEELIESHGMSYQFVAKKLGITAQALWNKRRNKTPFTAPEIDMLCDLLHITRLTDKERIFFSKDVD